MKCDYCGFEYQQSTNFCPRCGKQTFSDVVTLNPIADRVSAVFTSGLYLAICILMSIYTLLSLGENGGIPIFDVLFSIFLWIGFSQGKKGFVDHTQIRNLSGTVFAYYVMQYIVSGLLTLLGVLISLVFNVLKASPLEFNEIMEEADFGSLPYGDILKNLFASLGDIFLVFFVVIALILFIVNIFGIRKIHKFLQSLYRSVEYNKNRIVCAKAAKNWLIVLGIFGFVSSLLTFLAVPLASSIIATELPEASAVLGVAAGLSILLSSCQSLCGIFAGVLIGKHFTQN